MVIIAHGLRREKIDTEEGQLANPKARPFLFNHTARSGSYEHGAHDLLSAVSDRQNKEMQIESSLWAYFYKERER